MSLLSIAACNNYEFLIITVLSFQVYLQASHRDLLALLKIQVEPQRQRVDKVFHFYHPERTFIKKHFTIDINDIITRSPNGPTTATELFACCSDPNAVSDIKENVDSSSHTLYLKVPVKASPTSHSLYIMLFNEKYLVAPFEVWLVVLHPVCRIDHSVVKGQSSDIRMMLRGDHVNRRVACYSFSAPVMKVGYYDRQRFKKKGKNVNTVVKLANTWLQRNPPWLYYLLRVAIYVNGIQCTTYILFQ